MRRLDKELLQRGIYVLPGVRRFVCDANTEEDFELTVAALHETCEVVASIEHGFTEKKGLR